MENIETIYSLSPMQQGMLFHTIYAQHKLGTYVEQFSITFHGDLNAAAFKQAWQQVFERHAVLRTTFYWEGLKKPIQKVHKQAKLPWVQLDWRTQSGEEQQVQLEAFLHADFTKGFSFDQAPLMRCTLIQIADATYQFVWSHHHILLDGCSLTIILKEVFIIYEAFCHGQHKHLEQPEPTASYSSC